jgi:hypothetical protein
MYTAAIAADTAAAAAALPVFSISTTHQNQDCFAVKPFLFFSQRSTFSRF